MDDRQITMNCHVVAKDGCVGVGSLVHRYEWQLCLFPHLEGLGAIHAVRRAHRIGPLRERNGQWDSGRNRGKADVTGEKQRNPAPWILMVYTIIYANLTHPV